VRLQDPIDFPSLIEASKPPTGHLNGKMEAGGGRGREAASAVGSKDQVCVHGCVCIGADVGVGRGVGVCLAMGDKNKYEGTGHLTTSATVHNH
jgi:hypothetical protein